MFFKKNVTVFKEKNQEDIDIMKIKIQKEKEKIASCICNFSSELRLLSLYTTVTISTKKIEELIAIVQTDPNKALLSLKELMSERLIPFGYACDLVKSIEELKYALNNFDVRLEKLKTLVERQSRRLKFKEDSVALFQNLVRLGLKEFFNMISLEGEILKATVEAMIEIARNNPEEVRQQLEKTDLPFIFRETTPELIDSIIKNCQELKENFDDYKYGKELHTYASHALKEISGVSCTAEEGMHMLKP